MTKPQVAIVLPEEWVDFRDGLGQPIWPEELAEALDEIKGEHREFEICGMFKGSLDEQSSHINLRLHIENSGHIMFSLSDAAGAGPGLPLGVDIDRVNRSGLRATIVGVLTAYSRKYHQTS